MKLYDFFNIIILFSIIICDDNEEEEEETWRSPCETQKNPKNFEDCTRRSTEYIYEICCYLKASSNDSNIMEEECIDITRDDTRNQGTLNLAKEKIKNCTYWEDNNETYYMIESLRCYNKYIFPNFILINYFIFLLVIIY